MPGLSFPWGFSTGAGHQTHAEIDAMRDAGADIIRTTLDWPDIDPNLDGSMVGANWTYIDDLVNYCKNLVLNDGSTGMKVILQMGIGGPPAKGGNGGRMYVPSVMKAWAKMIKAVAARDQNVWGRALHALECGNEPNHDKYDDGVESGVAKYTGRGAAFAETMIRIYDAAFENVKSVNPTLPIMIGGLGGEGTSKGPTAYDFTVQMYQPVSVGAAPSVAMVAGITTGDPNNGTPTQRNSLLAMPKRTMLRCVFDQGQPASAYTSSVTTLSAAADIMGELIDSTYIPTLTAGAGGTYELRAQEYLATLGNVVDVWEVGNEVNGDWTGPYSQVADKILRAFNVFNNAGKQTALTLYYNPLGLDGPGELTPAQFTTTYVTNTTMRNGLDYVWLSYYEVDFANHRPDAAEMTAVFEELHTLYPNAKLGFGEIGLHNQVNAGTLAQANDIMAYYYSLNIDLPYYVGGYFWWYGRQDVLRGPATMKTQFNNAINSMPAATGGSNTLFPNGIKGHFDVFSSHPYTYPNSPIGDSAWGQLLQTRSYIVSQGDDKPIALTEVGAPNYGTETNQQNALIMKDVATLYSSYTWAWAICWFRYADKDLPNPPTLPDSQDLHFGIVTADVPPVHKPFIYDMFLDLATNGLMPPFPPVTTDARYGAGFTPSHGNSARMGRQFDRASDLLLDYVRCDVQWNTIQPSNPTSAAAGFNNSFTWTYVDDILAACLARGLKWLCMFGYGADWTRTGTSGDDKIGPDRDPTHNYPDYANAIWNLINHCKTTAGGIYADVLCGVEIWNEPNIRIFFHNASGAIDPVRYSKMLVGAYRALKQGIVGTQAARQSFPDLPIISGGTAPPPSPPTLDHEPRQWVIDLFNNGAGYSFDYFGVHTYMWEYGPLYGANPGNPGYPATWNVFTECRDIRATLLAPPGGLPGRPDALLWSTEQGMASRPDNSGTDVTTGSGNGGYSGLPGHVAPSPGYTTDPKLITYKLAAQRVLEYDTSWRTFLVDAGGRYTVGQVWYGVIEDTATTYPGNWDKLLGVWVAGDNTTTGALKVPLTGPTIRDNLRSLVLTNLPPVSSFTWPQNGATVKGQTTFVATATDDSDVASQLVLHLWHVAGTGDVDHGVMTMVGTAWQCDVDTRTLENGTYQFYVVATDSDGASAPSPNRTIAVNNVEPVALPPTVNIASPANNAIITSGSIVFAISTSSVNDFSPHVNLVEGTLDLGRATLVPPYGWFFNLDVVGVAPGIYTFYARSTDSVGNIGLSQTVSLNIGDFVPPPPPVEFRYPSSCGPIGTAYIGEAGMGMLCTAPSLVVVPEGPPPIDIVTGACVDQLWLKLPDFYRTADPQQNPPYPLLVYTRAASQGLCRVEQLYDRIDYRSPENGGPVHSTSDLVDPQTADAAWLPWLAQLIGDDMRHLGVFPSEADQRNAISHATSGWQAGSTQSLADAVSALLQGQRQVTVVPRYGGDPHTILLFSFEDETPVGYAEILQTIEDADVKPAGIKIVVEIRLGASYDQLRQYWAQSPYNDVTYNDLDDEFTDYDDITTWHP